MREASVYSPRNCIDPPAPAYGSANGGGDRYCCSGSRKSCCEPSLQPPSDPSGLHVRPGLRPSVSHDCASRTTLREACLHARVFAQTPADVQALTSEQSCRSAPAGWRPDAAQILISTRRSFCSSPQVRPCGRAPVSVTISAAMRAAVCCSAVRFLAAAVRRGAVASNRLAAAVWTFWQAGCCS